MIWNRWRQRLTYLAMSVFLAWHTLAMVIAPAPDSVSAQTLRAALQPYLTLFRLDNPWNFFAPAVGYGSELRYVIENADGARLTVAPTEQLSRFHPGYLWFRAWHYAIIDDPELHAESAAAFLCRQHASFHPVSITFLQYEEGIFTPADHLGGKSPMDPGLVTVHTVKTVECPAS
jgi:hypothetical protein